MLMLRRHPPGRPPPTGPAVTASGVPQMLRLPRPWLGRLVLLLVLAAAYLAASFRRVPAGGEVVIRDSPVLKATPRVLPPGWHLVPAGVLAAYRYPVAEGRLALSLDAAHGHALQARDGAPVGIEID